MRGKYARCQGGLGTCSEGDLYGFTVCDLLPKASFGQIIIHYGRDDKKCLNACGWTNSVLSHYRSFDFAQDDTVEAMSSPEEREPVWLTS